MNTYAGALAKVNPDGTLSLLADGLNQQTSVEIIKNTAYIVTLTGEVWKIENRSHPPYGNGSSFLLILFPNSM